MVEVVRKLFVTAIGGDVACSIIKCLKESFEEIEIIGCDITSYNAGYNLVDKFFTAPQYTCKKEYWEFVKNICLAERVTYYLPIAEPEIIIADEYRDFFEINEIKLMVNNHDIIDIAMNKYKTAKYLEQFNIDVPETWCLDELNEIDNYPVIVKSESGCGSSNVKKANDAIEMMHGVMELSNPIIQQYIEGEEFTVGIFSDGIIVNSIAFRRKLRGGMTVWVESVNDIELQRISQKIATIFKLKGCINVQLRKKDGKYYIFEINPRISGTAGFRHKIGFTDVIWWIDLLDGKKAISEFKYKHDIVGVKQYDEVVFLKNN